MMLLNDIVVVSGELLCCVSAALRWALDLLSPVRRRRALDLDLQSSLSPRRVRTTWPPPTTTQQTRKMYPEN